MHRGAGSLLFLIAWAAVLKGIARVRAITEPADVEALKQLKSALEPMSIHAGSCLSTWNFSLDPCDNRFGAAFACAFDCQTDSRGIQRVTSVKLDSVGYEGVLSPSIGNLSALQFLLVSGNAIRGSIPVSIGQLSQLRVLDLSSNSLSGSIPESVGSLRSLENLNVANNLLDGPLPGSLNNLAALSDLKMQSNKLNSSIPNLSTLKQLQLVDLSSNGLSGEVSLFQFPASVFYLSLKSNLLSGGLPKNSLKRFELLEVFDLSDNRLSGPIDESFFEHPTLQQLNLSHNGFTAIEGMAGDYAQSGLQSQLVAIDLSYNQISGQLPIPIANMKQLSSLSLSQNSLSGRIPLRYAIKALAGLIGLQPLERLMLDGNYLTGPLPAQLMMLLPGKIVASFVDNCLRDCPAKLFFCQGGSQKPENICRLFNTGA